MRALVAVAPIAVALALCACSGADQNVFPTPPPPEAGPPSVDNGDGGDLYDGGSFGDAPSVAVVCAPQGVGTFSPAWTPPEPWKQKVCTSTQLAGFYAACLTPPISLETCQTFVQQNAACASCLQSQDTASTAAAVVWHEHDAYWTVNVAGCIARATGDTAAGGCGASYAAAIACRQQSCNACWQAQGTTATFPEFSSCEQQAGESTCKTFAEAVPSACGDLTGSPASVCMPPSGSTAHGAFMQVAPLFCGAQ